MAADAKTRDVRGAELDSSVATGIREFVIQELLGCWCQSPVWQRVLGSNPAMCTPPKICLSRPSSTHPQTGHTGICCRQQNVLHSATDGTEIGTRVACWRPFCRIPVLHLLLLVLGPLSFYRLLTYPGVLACLLVSPPCRTPFPGGPGQPLLAAGTASWYH